MNYKQQYRAFVAAMVVLSPVLLPLMAARIATDWTFNKLVSVPYWLSGIPMIEEEWD